MIDALELAGAFVLGFLLCAVFSGLLIRELVRLHREERQLGRLDADSWRSERREILNRIQHPNKMPVANAGPPRPADPAVRERMREMASVGRVVPANGDMELP
jgi:hypothetical protein